MAQEHVHFTDLTQSTVRRLVISLGLTAAFVVVEIVAGFFANSLALLTDAAHNATDVIALALTWWALRITTKPANQAKTFGYHRAGILAAMVNSTTLVLIAGGIFYDAYRRLLDPSEVKADVLIAVGVAAVLVNLVTALLVRRGSDHDLNLKSAYLHLMGDVLSTVGAVLAGIIIRFTHLNWVDSLASILIGFLILWNAWGILRESINILMESTPSDINMDALKSDILMIVGVAGVHDLHVWSITRSLRTLSAHIVTDDISIGQGSVIQSAVSEMLSHTYGIGHATLQLECMDCVSPDLFCDITANNHNHNPCAS
jgi:cobalt-zinc-cadmium efflux system protein